MASGCQDQIVKKKFCLKNLVASAAVDCYCCLTDYGKSSVGQTTWGFLEMENESPFCYLLSAKS